MRAVIQRVKTAKVEVDGKIVSEIGVGFLILFGVSTEDEATDIGWLSNKIVNLRVFDDDQGVMNQSIADIGGDIILVSQFTLHASTKKGNRPSYIKAARPEKAIPLYEQMIRQLSTDLKKPIGTGIFGADMKVNLTNDGPVTIIIDTENKE